MRKDIFRKIMRPAIRATVLSSLGLAGIAGDVSAQNKQLTIPFGQENKIVFSLGTGTYDVYFSGKKYVSKAYAAFKGQAVADSRSVEGWRYNVKTSTSGIGKGKQFTISSADKSIQLLFTTFTGKDYFVAECKVKGASNYIAPLVTDSLFLYEQGDLRCLFVPFDNDMWVRYNAQPVRGARLTSSEVTAVYNEESNKGIVLGSLEHATWKSGVRFRGDEAGAGGRMELFGGFTDGGITHDSISHGIVAPVNGYCSSPRMFVGLFSDWRAGMEAYASLNVKAESRIISPWKKATPIGWNSWGSLQTKLNAENARKVVDYFYDSCKFFRTADNTLYIDLDSYWDNMSPSGIDGETSVLSGFANYCKRKGFKPGIYWAPFVDWGKYSRKVEGSDMDYSQTWLLQNGKVVDVDGGRAMDPTHPATRKRLVHYFERFKALGFEMVKIDFLVHGAFEADHFFDPQVTTGMQAFHSGMALLDSVVDNQLLLYAAISPSLATARYVHMRRIACDAFSAIDNTEYTLNSTGYGWWQGHMYDFLDADHVVFGRESKGSNRARLASAVITGSVVTGDDYSSDGPWRAAAASLLQNKELLALAHHGKAFRPLITNTGKGGVQAFVQEWGGYRYLALFNFSNVESSLPVPFARAGIKSGAKADELFSGKQVTLGNSIRIGAADALIFRVK